VDSLASAPDVLETEEFEEDGDETEAEPAVLGVGSGRVCRLSLCLADVPVPYALAVVAENPDGR
jgi:hypothetical protein